MLAGSGDVDGGVRAEAAFAASHEPPVVTDWINKLRLELIIVDSLFDVG